MHLVIKHMNTRNIQATETKTSRNRILDTSSTSNNNNREQQRPGCITTNTTKDIEGNTSAELVAPLFAIKPLLPFFLVQVCV